MLEFETEEQRNNFQGDCKNQFEIKKKLFVVEVNNQAGQPGAEEDKGEVEEGPEGLVRAGELEDHGPLGPLLGYDLQKQKNHQNVKNENDELEEQLEHQD